MSTAATRSTKSQQINFRATDRQVAVLRRAAAAADRTLTDFVLDSAVERAEMMLADRRWFSVTGEQWDEFVALLDAPLPSTKFQELKARRDPFADE
ncbi:MAG TPA: DUF1778 domain-containing protein [Dermatophilaceae bacterium]|mgnify:FL=1|jgi:uncharacterized protein (DUF1778 family)|nr:DUF1778 domain-containing protein [Actinomycetales bacterium]HMT31055.1 DUF1778 domain-containing protein [Dermatophilaceae bacterium]HMT90057.1 DUF1778 domain-containing protein [Dermatophilaceae bacterium]